MLDIIYDHILETSQSKIALAGILWCILHAIPQGFIVGILTAVPMWAFLILLFVKVTSDTIDRSLESMISE